MASWVLLLSQRDLGLPQRLLQVLMAVFEKLLVSVVQMLDAALDVLLLVVADAECDPAALFQLLHLHLRWQTVLLVAFEVQAYL